MPSSTPAPPQLEEAPAPTESLQRFILRQQTIAWLFLALVALTITFSVNRLAHNTRLTQLAQQQLTTLESLYASAADQQAGLRGYLLAGEERFLEPYHKGLANYPRHLAVLDRLVAIDPRTTPERRETLATLRTLHAEWLERIATPQITVRREQGLTAAARLVQQGGGKRLMDEIRSLIEQQQRQQAQRHAQLSQANATTLQQLRLLTLAGLLAALLVSISSLTRTTRALSRSFDRLALAARRIASGHLGERVPSETLVETATLARSFNDMSRSLQAREAALHDAAQLNHSILSAVGEGVFGLDPQGRVTFANPAALTLTGYSREEMIGQLQHDLIHHSHREGTPYPVIQCPITRTRQDGQVHRVDDEVFWRKDGTCFSVEYVATPLLNEQGDITGAVVSFRDITERRRAERELREANEELRRSNRDLEQFVYVASHDLQEPLRTISSFSELLAKRYQGQLDERGEQYLSFIGDGARRMKDIIQDVLVMSRARAENLHVQDTSLSEVLDHVTQDLGEAIRDTDATITHSSLPVVHGDPAQLRQLLLNLLSNALKFRRPDLPPQVHINARDEGGHWHVSVRDNGIGIEPQYFERIFKVFQRLHHRQEYPGNGLGLAISQKVAERHGGRLWVESTPGQGSVFHFTLQKPAGRQPGQL